MTPEERAEALAVSTPLEQAREAARVAKEHHTATMDALDAAIDAERTARRAVWETNEAAWDAVRAERAMREDAQ